MILKYLRIVFLGLYDEVNGIKNVFIKIYCVIYYTFLCTLVACFTSYFKIVIFLYDSSSLLEATVVIVASLVTEDRYFFLFAEVVDTEFCDRKLFSSTVLRNRIFLAILAFIYSLCLFCSCICDLNPVLRHSVLFDGIIFISCCTGFYRMIVTFDLFRESLNYWRKTLKEDLGLPNTDDCEKTTLINNFVTSFLNLSGHLRPVRYVSKFLIGCGMISIILKIAMFSLHCLSVNSVYSSTDEYFRKYLLGTILWVPKIVMNFMLMSIPIMTLELANDTLADIMEILSEQLVVHKDKALRAAVENAIMCIENRPSCTIWRNYPMDISLSFSCMSLVITYTISMLQFIY